MFGYTFSAQQLQGTTYYMGVWNEALSADDHKAMSDFLHAKLFAGSPDATLGDVAEVPVTTPDTTTTTTTTTTAATATPTTTTTPSKKAAKDIVDPYIVSAAGASLAVGAAGLAWANADWIRAKFHRS